VSEQANIETAQAGYAAFGRGDVPAILELLTDDIEWVDPGPPGVIPTAGTHRGKAAVMAWFGVLDENMEFQVFEPREAIVQGDKVVYLVYVEAAVRSNGRKIVTDEAHVWSFKDGKVARIQLFTDTEAIAAAYRGD
jgi:ketosteroid isomerase-like protein